MIIWEGMAKEGITKKWGDSKRGHPPQRAREAVQVLGHRESKYLHQTVEEKAVSWLFLREDRDFDSTALEKLHCLCAVLLYQHLASNKKGKEIMKKSVEKHRGQNRGCSSRLESKAGKSDLFLPLQKKKII